MLACELASGGARKTGFQSKDEREFELVKHGDARCGFLRFGHFKGTVSEVKVVNVLLHEIGEEFWLDKLKVFFKVLWWVLHLVHFVTILKHIFLDAVTMHVKIEVKLLIKWFIH
jgi:hypothetical protein